jgi:hypothetical protein
MPNIMIVATVDCWFDPQAASALPFLSTCGGPVGSVSPKIARARQSQCTVHPGRSARTLAERVPEGAARAFCDLKVDSALSATLVPYDPWCDRVRRSVHSSFVTCWLSARMGLKVRGATMNQIGRAA